VVKPRDCRHWIALRESVHSRNVPGRRLPAASSALQSGRSLEVKDELKEFSQHLKALSLKINTQPVDPFIRYPSVKTTVWSR
jgi:hypothetical protein